MKKWMIAGGLMMMISLSTFAQKGTGERRTPEQRATRITEKMAEELTLNEAQKKQILEINLEYAKKRESEMEARKAEMKEQDSKLQQVLTEEQRSKWVKLKDDKRESWKKGRPNAQIEGTHDPLKAKKSGGN
jgi:Spy/CpxP family protein refolding chaperone